MSDRLLVALSRDRLYRARAATTSSLVQDAMGRHDLGALAAHALARALTSAALFPVSFKDCDRVSIQWSGGGALRTILVELREPGTVRGYVRVPDASLPTIDVTARRIGKGLLPGGTVAVVKQRPDGTWGQGQVALESGEIDEDLEAWFAGSEQVPTRLRTAFSLKGGAPAACGVLVQAMPGGDPDALPPADLHARIRAHDAPEALLDAAFQGRPYDVLEVLPLSYACPCTRERAKNGVLLLGAEDLSDLLRTEGRATVRCEFCAQVFSFERPELEELLAMKGGAS